MSDQNSDMNNNFKIIFIKINTIRLISLRSTLRIPISLLKKVTLIRSSLTKIISSLKNKSTSGSLIIFLVTNQLGTNFNVDRK